MLDKMHALNTCEMIRQMGSIKGKLKQLTSIWSLYMTHKSMMNDSTKILKFRKTAHKTHTSSLQYGRRHVHLHINLESSTTLVLPHARSRKKVIAIGDDSLRWVQSHSSIPLG